MTDHDRVLWAVLDASTLGRVRASGAAPWRRAWHTSRVAALVSGLRTGWTSGSGADRCRLSGLAAITAATTHVALQLTVRPVGWWWLIVPGSVLAFGIFAVGASVSAARGHD